MSEAVVAKRGRPRNAETHQSILDAANSILAEHGYRGFSIEAVATLAGVSKTSIYRRWPSKGALLLDLYMSGMDDRAFDATEGRPIREVFQTYLNLSVKQLKSPTWANTIQSLVAEAQGDDELSLMVRDKVIEPRREAGRRLLQRGQKEGQIDPSIDTEIVLDCVFGAVWYRLLLGHLPMDQSFADRMIDQIFSWITLKD